MRQKTIITFEIEGLYIPPDLDPKEVEAIIKKTVDKREAALSLAARHIEKDEDLPEPMRKQTAQAVTTLNYIL